MDKTAKVTPGNETQPLDEQKLRNLMAKEGLRPYRWSNSPYDVYSAHRHNYDKVIYVVRGSITFGLPQTSEKIHLSAGDRLDLPQGVVHNAQVGPNGVVCLEAQK